VARSFDTTAFLWGMGLVALGALLLRAISDMPFWACFLIALGALLVNGWLAEWEDNQPGGFNNPRDEDKRN
jgi:hypothetical protein